MKYNERMMKLKGNKKLLRTTTGALLLSVGALLLFIALSATWLNRTVLDQASFVEVSKHELAKQENRQAIASVIVNESLGSQSIANQLIGSRATGLIAGLLGTDIAGRTFDYVANNTYRYLTNPDRSDLAIDLSSMKAMLSRVVSLAGSTGVATVPTDYKIPSKITLLRSDAVPNLSGYFRAMILVEILAWSLVAICLAVYLFSAGKKYRVARVYRAAAVTTGVAIFGLFAGPLVPRAIVMFINDLPSRELIANLTSAFLAPFYAMLWVVIVVAIIVCIVTALRSLFVKLAVQARAVVLRRA